MSLFLIAILAILPVVYLSPSVPPLTVGAFNIQIFGPTKAGKPDVMENIAQIVTAYDIILIQEIRHKSGQCMDDLLDLLNSVSPDQYAYVASERLGRTTSKEQYAYYYRVNKVTIVNTHQYDDSRDDVFEREPFSVLIRVDTSLGSKDIALVGVHIKPDDALSEIQNMESVYDDVKAAFNTEEMLIMGDMNADCSYMSQASRDQTVMFTNATKYWSVIGNDADTTTYSTDCSYDRIMVSGTYLRNNVYGFGIDDFKADLGLTEEEMKDVSDHYPVWIKINLQ